jgi:hypothetical protein
MLKGRGFTIQHPEDTKDKKVLNFGDVILPVPED